MLLACDADVPIRTSLADPPSTSPTFGRIVQRVRYSWACYRVKERFSSWAIQTPTVRDGLSADDLVLDSPLRGPGPARRR